MSDLDFLIIDFSGEKHHFHLGKEKATYQEAFDYQRSLSEGWFFIVPRMLTIKDRLLLESKLHPLKPVNFWSNQGAPDHITDRKGMRQGLYIKSKT